MKKTSLFFILQLVLVGFVHSSEPSNSNRIFRSSTDYPTNSNILVGKGLGSIFQKSTTRFSYACILALMLLFSFSKTNAQSSIIGNPIKIGNIEVAQFDFRKIPWIDANNSCMSLGDGWRLPTIDELKILYQNRESIGNFKWDSYWSSTKGNIVIAWRLNFGDGMAYDRDNTDNTAFVRAVRNSIINTTQLNEQKTETYQNGDKYVGEMKNRMRNGYGEYYYANGDVYRGNFLNNNKHSYGEYYYANGDVYRGNWLNNNKHGESEYFFSNTKKTERLVFENNVQKSAIVAENKQANSQSSGTATNQTTSNPKQTVNVSNSSIDFVRVGKIDIMTKDLGEFNYSQAKNAIQALGEGWRLPNESELLIMFNNQDKIGQLRKKPMLRNQNQIFWGAYLGGSFSNYLVIMNNSVNPGLTYSTYWSENRERLENEFYLVRAVRDVPSKDLRITSEEKKANDDAYTKLVEIIFRKMLTEALSGSSGSSNQSSSFTDRTPSQSGSTSSGLEVCTYCKPNDSKGHWITDYNPYKKTNENGRWVLRPGHRPCDQCYGTGNCKRRNMCLPSVDSDWAMGRNVDLTCNICLGERFQVCKWCDGSGYRRK